MKYLFCLAFYWFLIIGDGNIEITAATSQNSQPIDSQHVKVSQRPRISPDYIDVVIPPNLAPLNLTILEDGNEFRLRVKGSNGQTIEIRQESPHIRFPIAQWKELLRSCAGGTLQWDIAVYNKTGTWISYDTFENRVASENIDPYLVYRRLHPLYTSYKHLNIFQRHLETFDEKPVVRNEKFNYGCVNCHTFQEGSPDRFAISFRARSGTPTLLINSNQITRIDIKMGYLSWHPNGKLLAFAENTITQFFHIAGSINRDIYDPSADIKIYNLDNKKVEKPAAIASQGRSENWPSWSVDGRYLYYCSAPTLSFREERNFRADLLRVPFDPDKNSWGEPELLFSSSKYQLSAHQPRMSPDGRFLIFTVSDSGSFPAFRANCDFYLLHLNSQKIEPLPINSKYSETWPCWSRNNRWLVFSSRRIDGVFARLFITHVDTEGHFSKPLIIPQENPAYYDNCLDNFNVPELIQGPITISEEELVRVVNAPAKPKDASDKSPQDRNEYDSKALNNPYQ